MIDQQEGITELEHTADVGLALTGTTQAELFDRAAKGMLQLVGVRAPGTVPGQADPPNGERMIELSAPDAEVLLVRWLQELLFLLEVEHFAYGSAEFDRLGETGVTARITGWKDHGERTRELKGVTYHELQVRRGPDGWSARVIFDL